MEELLKQIKVVAEARQKAHTTQEAKRLAYAQWENQMRELLDEATRTSQIAVEEEAKLRELALQVYEQTGNKSLATGVSIKIFQMLDYDPKEALN